jgi:hypothetical protein
MWSANALFPPEEDLKGWKSFPMKCSRVRLTIEDLVEALEQRQDSCSASSQASLDGRDNQYSSARF